MKKPSKSEIDEIRKAGFRPQVVACILSSRKILFLYAEKHDLWQFPQGGIDNGEDIAAAFLREMTEELGGEFVKTFGDDLLYFGENEMLFPDQEQNSRALRNDEGQAVFMRGKKYFFISVQADRTKFNISNSEFDDFKWLSFEEGLVICEKIYQKGKKRITSKALVQLQELGWL